MKNPFVGPWRIIWMSDWDQGPWICGDRGWRIAGPHYVHLGDESAFRAVKQTPPARGRKTAS